MGLCNASCISSEEAKDAQDDLSLDDVPLPSGGFLTFIPRLPGVSTPGFKMALYSAQRSSYTRSSNMIQTLYDVSKMPTDIIALCVSYVRSYMYSNCLTDQYMLWIPNDCPPHYKLCNCTNNFRCCHSGAIRSWPAGFMI